MAKVISFRRLKRADPAKFKVLVEDLPNRWWLDRLSPAHFVMVVVAGSLAMALVVATLA